MVPPITWSVSPLVGVYLRDIAFGLGVFCGVGSAGNSSYDGVYLSADGVTWTKRPVPVQEGQERWGFDRVIWTGSQFCVIGESGACTSFDGINWTVGTCPDTDPTFPVYRQLSSVVWTGTQFVGAPRNRNFIDAFTVFTSADGALWRRQAEFSGAKKAIWDMAYCGGSTLYAVGGIDNGTQFGAHADYVSTDSGITWTRNMTPPDVTDSYLVAYGLSRICVIGKKLGNWYASISMNGGATWMRSAALDTGGQSINGLMFDGTVFRAPGLNFCMVSEDGVAWALEPAGTSVQWSTYASGNGVSLMIGTDYMSGKNVIASSKSKAFVPFWQGYVKCYERP